MSANTYLSVCPSLWCLSILPYVYFQRMFGYSVSMQSSWCFSPDCDTSVSKRFPLCFSPGYNSKGCVGTCHSAAWRPWRGRRSVDMDNRRTTNRKQPVGTRTTRRQWAVFTCVFIAWHCSIRVRRRLLWWHGTLRVRELFAVCVLFFQC
jgi:hypothetical protein